MQRIEILFSLKQMRKNPLKQMPKKNPEARALARKMSPERCLVAMFLIDFDKKAATNYDIREWSQQPYSVSHSFSLYTFEHMLHSTFFEEAKPCLAGGIFLNPAAAQDIKHCTPILNYSPIQQHHRLTRSQMHTFSDSIRFHGLTRPWVTWESKPRCLHLFYDIR